MRVRYHSIRGKAVRTADRRRVGRVTDLVAMAQGDALCVTTLLVGPGGLVRRMGFKRLLGEPRARRVPWHLVADIGDEVRLLVGYDELEALLSEEKVGAEEHEPDTREQTA